MSVIDHDLRCAIDFDARYAAYVSTAVVFREGLWDWAEPFDASVLYALGRIVV